jgi:hypothetical protein
MVRARLAAARIQYSDSVHVLLFGQQFVCVLFCRHKTACRNLKSALKLFHWELPIAN